MTIPPGPSTQALTAIAHGLDDRIDAAHEVLRSVVKEGVHPTLHLLVTLAEVIHADARQTAPLSGPVYPMIEDEDTGEPLDVDEVSPGLRFAVQFVSACLNDDMDMAVILYSALVNHVAHNDGEYTIDLVIAVKAIYQWALSAARATRARASFPTEYRQWLSAFMARPPFYKGK